MVALLCKTSLRWRLTLLISGSVVLPMFGTLLIASYQGSQILRKEAEDKLILQAESLAHKVTQWDQKVVQIIQNLSLQPAIRDMDGEEQEPVLKAGIAVYPDIYLINTLDTDGFNVARSDRNPLKYYGDRNYFKQAIAGQEVSREILLGRTLDKPAIVFSTPINQTLYAEDPEIVGVLALAITLTEVTEQVQAIKVGKTGYAFVVDSQGKILAHPHSPQFKALQDFHEYPPVKSLINGRSGLLIFEDSDQNKWVSYSIVLANGWGAIVQQQKSEILNQVYQFWQFSTVLAVGVLIAVGGITWVISTQTIQPLRQLNRAVQLTAQGDLSQSVIAKKPDEIGLLAQSFNAMAHQLKDLFDQLEEKVKERTGELAKANQLITALNHKLTLENGRMGAELLILAEMQNMVLPKPKELQGIEELDIATYMQSATEVGGDYYDILPHPGGIAFCIGDVTGHGLESGILMVMTQAAVRTLIESKSHDFIEILNTLNQTLYKSIQRMESDKNITLSLVNYANYKLIISGQHEEVIIGRANGTLERIDTMDLGLPIGLEEDITPFLNYLTLDLAPGDGVVLYTDGITEARNKAKQMYGIERLCEVVRQFWSQPAEEIKQAILVDFNQFLGENALHDDITLVIFKC
ncbi:SpoIIE family protein phosphatase [Laspinema olomoucense]|uniref:SpoIIE family protein phosphatase n=1 Tax=Laspinema olomoucense D3b TaxID=2953688 RepID=A0ABT2NE42_9CYAN|nr:MULTISPECIES: SpoIIE family protein phosphatase [unclassified Laspinema]MCT7975581.1 SpoIIE family protein phosphatase [Laspinema sp. D3d]MCT7980968.1 SpoIIE family protein phosphatase [Laspinema sp. D3b]MCT7991540.1 SpoIIE family protein phosphatase [Laspinema sp. D3a]